MSQIRLGVMAPLPEGPEEALQFGLKRLDQRLEAGALGVEHERDTRRARLGRQRRGQGAREEGATEKQSTPTRRHGRST